MNVIQRDTQPVPGDTWSVALGQSPTGPPLATGDLLLVPTQEPGMPAQHAVLHTLEPGTGNPRWQRRFEHALVSGLAAAPASDAFPGLILVTTTSTDLIHGQAALVALDAAGEEQYRWAPGVQRVSAPAVAGDVACVTVDAGTFVALDLATGAERARAPLDTSGSLAAPAVTGDMAIVPCRGPYLLAVGLDGHPRWRFDAAADPHAWLDKTPALAGEHLVCVLSTGAALALRVADGALAWRVDVGPAGKPLSPPASDGERAFIGARDGLHALALADGHEVWTFPTPRRITAAPVVTGGVVYAACHDHHLYALDAATGGELWRHEAERRIEVSPALAGCGEPPAPHAIVAGRGGTLTAITRPLSAAEHEAAGHWLEAAAAYAGLGRFARSAELLQAHGEPLKAAEAWQKAGHRERAAAQFEAAGAWQPAAELWAALGQPLRQAEALEAHARSLECASCGDQERAAAWGAVARLLEAEGETERAESCRRETARWLQQPVITLEVEHGGLVRGAWSRLQFIVRNEGYGPARNLVIRASGDQFEGQVTATRQIVTLRAGRDRIDWLDVRPRAYGDHVPLRVRVEYENATGEMCTCEQTIYIPVAQGDDARGAGGVVSVFQAPRDIDYELGLRRLRELLDEHAPTRLPGFYALEARLLGNLRDEQMYGSTETVRAERARVLQALNGLADQAELESSFNDLCRR